MSASCQHEIRWLLQELRDPFPVFPLQSVSRILGEQLSKSEEDFASRQGPYGVARKYWDVESEHLHAQSGLLVGATFVLAQTALTQTISILARVRGAMGTPSGIPESRSTILEMDAPVVRKN